MSLGESLRADAIAGLVFAAKSHEKLLNKLASDRNRVISEEANRALVAARLTKRHVIEKPEADQIDDWIELIDRQSTGTPDTAVGRRLFLQPRFRKLLQVPCNPRTWQCCWSGPYKHSQSDRRHPGMVVKTHR